MSLQKILQRLIASGLTQQEIATRCSTTQTTISALYSGRRTTTSFEVGTAISKLHDQQLPKKRVGR